MKKPTKVVCPIYIGMKSKWQYEDAKDTAMNRFNIKKSKRVHVSALMDEFITLLSEDEGFNEGDTLEQYKYDGDT